MTKCNTYLEKRRIAREVITNAAKETYIQFMIDMLELTLNDPEIMGKDTFGEKRIKKVVEGLGKKYAEFHGALERRDDADYLQIKLDQNLREIFGEDLVRFGTRYPWIRDLA